MKKYYKIIINLLLLTLCISCKVYASDTTDTAEKIANRAQEYMNYIGTNLLVRNAVTADNKTDSNNSHDETIQWIENELSNVGIESSQVQEQKFTKKDNDIEYEGTNIVVTLEGEDNSKQIVVGAHYDGDGVGDNGSGIALLLAVIAETSKVELPNKVVFVFFDAEEVGEFGSEYFVKKMSFMEKAHTLFMVNIDSIAFGDYCNIYGGVQNDDKQIVTHTEAYELAVNKAKELGMKVYTTKELNGYYKEHGKGPDIEENAIYTNPWTYENPSPANENELPTYASPATGEWGDQSAFQEEGIAFIQFEATNWYAKGSDESLAYTGFYETDDTSVGKNGMFMNTEYDTIENLNTIFPGRAYSHFEVYSKLLTKLLQEPDVSLNRQLSLRDYMIGGILLLAFAFVLLFIVMIRKIRRKRNI